MMRIEADTDVVAVVDVAPGHGMPFVDAGLIVARSLLQAFCGRFALSHGAVPVMVSLLRE
ncbi:hypothetical protein [Rhodanobacter sp. C05]|uniref:hypothetical protein n=1 Tax=Rhodanobacter sp. C05 TaxID=1945855 RepID=UPI00117AA221|nr:hypothetical protein [Rhodanobacter sp. C05]